MVDRRDYDALAEAGGLPKPQGRRKAGTGREQHNSGLKSYAPMKRVNKERLEERRAETHGPQHYACFELPCCACGREGASVGHEEPPRSVGGKDSDAVPLCDLTRLHGVPGCHQKRMQMGTLSFWREVGLDPEDVKAAIAEWVKAGKPQGQKPFGGAR